jgi:GT2 family glycosyltransferase
LRLSIIVPFHRNLSQLSRCLAAMQPWRPDMELIVVADGAQEDCLAMVSQAGGQLVSIPGPSGPAVARNRGAAVARGDILVFVDSDVVIAPENIGLLEARFEERADVAALFGAYDEDPPEPHFVSQYKNLAHSYIHQSSNPVAQTFWAGFGAIRASVFRSVGGFDERFTRPCIEDIDLGYRLVAAGHTVLLDHHLRVSHLKRWTLRSLITTDVFDRGIPWTQSILKFGRFNNDLNLKSAYRIGVVMSYVLPVLLLLSLRDARFLLGTLPVAGVLIYSNRGFYRYFVERRGLAFALRVIPLQYLNHLYSGLSFAVGSMLFVASRWGGLTLPGSLPLDPWPGPAPRPAADLPGSSPTVRSTLP